MLSRASNQNFTSLAGMAFLPHGSWPSVDRPFSKETNTRPHGYPSSIQKSQGGGMQGRRRNLALIEMGLLNILMGLALAVGGVWLIALGGSWYYAIAAVAFLATGYLLMAARPA